MVRMASLALACLFSWTAWAADMGNVHKVSIKGMAFVPATLSIKAGDTVEWTNDDIVPHTVTGAGFDSQAIALGSSWRHRFATAGAVAYKCAFHPSMTAQMIVK